MERCVIKKLKGNYTLKTARVGDYFQLLSDTVKFDTESRIVFRVYKVNESTISAIGVMYAHGIESDKLCDFNKSESVQYLKLESITFSEVDPELDYDDNGVD